MNVFITGVTGFLGGEVLVRLSKEERVKKIYCLIRAKSIDEAQSKLFKVFNFHNDYFEEERIVPIIGNLLDEDLAIQLQANDQLKDVNVIIHSAANTSFSRIYDDLVEKTNIQGLESILKWATTLSKLQTFMYVGTATICGEGIQDRVIKEEESPNLESEHFVKYTYTKMMGEIMLKDYLNEDKILVVRPSIVMGDSRSRKPRSYVIMWALATMNLLRLVTVNAKKSLDIVSVDYVAEAMVQLLLSPKRKYQSYHISSGSHSCTSPEKVLNVISQFYTDRPDFKFLPIEFLNQVKLWAKGKKTDLAEMEGIDVYLNYLEKELGDKNKLRILLAGFEPYLEFIELGQVFDNTRLLEDVEIGPSIPAHEYILGNIEYLDKIDVLAGALDP